MRRIDYPLFYFGLYFDFRFNLKPPGGLQLPPFNFPGGFPIFPSTPVVLRECRFLPTLALPPFAR